MKVGISIIYASIVSLIWYITEEINISMFDMYYDYCVQIYS